MIKRHLQNDLHVSCFTNPQANECGIRFRRIDQQIGAQCADSANLQIVSATGTAWSASHRRACKRARGTSGLAVQHYTTETTHIIQLTP